MKDEQWGQQAAEVMSGMREWANQHPQATFAEIEKETMRRMAELQARLMQDLAQGMEEKGATVKCPECGAEVKRGQQKEKRSIQAAGGRIVDLERGYTVCSECGAGFFPPG